MTTIYDPHHPNYLDEADTRSELSRVFDVCGECRKCVTLCPTFPALVEIMEAMAAGSDPSSKREPLDAGAMTPSQQDFVSEQCYHCRLCTAQCPYSPGKHEYSIDFARLMLRARAMRRAAGLEPVRRKVVANVLGHVDVLGAAAVSLRSFLKVVSKSAKAVSKSTKAVSKSTNAVSRSPEAGAAAGPPDADGPDSIVARGARMATSLIGMRGLSRFAPSRFSTWFQQRPRVRLGQRQGSVSVYPTCVVEYRQPVIGQALVKVYEHNGIECSLSTARCCGAPYLHAGDVTSFVRTAVDNVSVLANEVRKGRAIVVAQPVCAHMLRRDYLDYVGGPDAQLVADNTFDPAEYLMELHATEGASLDTSFPGPVPDSITYHAPCHLRALGPTRRSRDLLKLTGTRVHMVEQCAGVGAAVGLSSGNAMDESLDTADRLIASINAADGEVVVGDCHRANSVIVERSGVTPVHPMQLLAAAYGIELPSSP